MPSSEIISVARLLLGSSNCCRLGSGPKKPKEASWTKKNKDKNGLSMVIQMKRIVLLLIVLLNYNSYRMNML